MIDGEEFFFWRSGTHDDLIAANLLQVESMQRLATFHHHVVGNIDDIVDRCDTDRTQSIDQPRRTWADLGSTNDASRVSRTSLRKLIDNTDRPRAR